MSDQEKVETLLNEQQFMVLAVTLLDGTPWPVPVKIQAHSGAVFEWDSKRSAEHSVAIENNPLVAITIYSHPPAALVGVYIKATAELIEEKDHGIGRYRATVQNMWLNDDTFVKREVALPAAG